MSLVVDMGWGSKLGTLLPGEAGGGWRSGLR